MEVYTCLNRIYNWLFVDIMAQDGVLVGHEQHIYILTLLGDIAIIGHELTKTSCLKAIPCINVHNGYQVFIWLF